MHMHIFDSFRLFNDNVYILLNVGSLHNAFEIRNAALIDLAYCI